MKKILLACGLLLAAVGAYAQGTVAFANTSTSLITNSTTGLVIQPAGTFRIGLYAGSLGTASNSLTLVGLATNNALAGRFSGGNPFTLPTQGSLYDGSQTITFQVRAWSFSSGLDYDTAKTDPNALTGVSVVGTVTPNPVGSGSPTPVLFGTAAGNVQGFTVVPNVPEPSSIAIGLLGLGAIALFRRRK